MRARALTYKPIGGTGEPPPIGAWVCAYIQDVLSDAPDGGGITGGLPNNPGKPAFSPDDMYLAVPCAVSPYLALYKKNGAGGYNQIDAGKIDVYPTGAAQSCAFSPDGRYLAVNHTTTPFITLYSVYAPEDIFTKQPNPASLPAGNGFYDCAFSPDGSWLALARSAQLYVYAFADGVLTLRQPTSLPGYEVRSVAFTPDGKYLLIESARTNSSTYYNLMRCYALASGTPTLSNSSDYSTTNSSVRGRGLAISPRSPGGAAGYWGVDSPNGTSKSRNTFKLSEGGVFTRTANASNTTAMFGAPVATTGAGAFTPDGLLYIYAQDASKNICFSAVSGGVYAAGTFTPVAGMTYATAFNIVINHAGDRALATTVNTAANGNYVWLAIDQRVYLDALTSGFAAAHAYDDLCGVGVTEAPPDARGDVLAQFSDAAKDFFGFRDDTVNAWRA
jgi:hypothetical protein